MSSTVLAAVAPDWVATAEHRGPFPERAGLPGEQHLVGAGRSAKRLQSLVARDQARRALAALGGPTKPDIPRGRGGAPILPPGYRGSLTHTHQYAGAAITAAPGISIGVDVEPVRRLDRRWHPFATPRETVMLGRLDRAHPDRPWALILFSAKEASYKAAFPVESRWIAMTHAEADLFPDGRFALKVVNAASPRHIHQGRWAVLDGLVATFSMIRTHACTPRKEMP